MAANTYATNITMTQRVELTMEEFKNAHPENYFYINDLEEYIPKSICLAFRLEVKSFFTIINSTTNVPEKLKLVCDWFDFLKQTKHIWLQYLPTTKFRTRIKDSLYSLHRELREYKYLPKKDKEFFREKLILYEEEFGFEQYCKTYTLKTGRCKKKTSSHLFCGVHRKRYPKIHAILMEKTPVCNDVASIIAMYSM